MPTPQFTNDPFVKAAAVTAHFDITDMTLWRWVKIRKFPKPIYINGIRYWKQSEIEQAEKDMSEPEFNVDHPFKYG